MQCRGIAFRAITFMLPHYTGVSPIHSISSRFFSKNIIVQPDVIDFSFVRSPGPGGQNVNKVNTKAEGRFNVYSATWLPEEVKERFIHLEKNNINSRGEFVISCCEQRSQSKNRDIVMNKIQEKVSYACIPQRKRNNITEVNDTVKRKWVDEKRKHSEIKQRRKGKENTIEHFSLLC